MERKNGEKQGTKVEIESEADLLKQELAKKEKIINELENEIKKLRADLIHDELTGLKTRKFFLEEMKDHLAIIHDYEDEKRKENPSNLSILFCDVDYFKKINDNLGHNFGDEILKTIAKILSDNLRESDAVCRWGGEEIVISLSETKENEAIEKADDLRKLVEDGIIEKYGNELEKFGLKISLSIGVVPAEHNLSVNDIIKRGDSAMYLAKKDGRNCVRSFSQIREEGKK